MGIRLEWFVILLIVITIGSATVVKLTNTQESTKSKSKELEFYKTAFTEVDTNKMQSQSFVNVGTRIEGVLTLKDLMYRTENISYLVADKATYKNNMLLLEDNVRLEEKLGYTYTTEHARYNQKSEILTINASFIAKKGKNIFRGTSLCYDSIKKEMNATQVDAMIYTTEK